MDLYLPPEDRFRSDLKWAPSGIQTKESLSPTVADVLELFTVDGIYKPLQFIDRF
jgi:hypothetical protein